jgi:hypothetical protein
MVCSSVLVSVFQSFPQHLITLLVINVHASLV